MKPLDPIQERPDVIFAAAIGLATLVLQLPFIRYHAVLLDEGLILQIGDELITTDKLPYRDRVHIVFPGIFYLTAAAFKIFGTSLEVARLLAAFAFSIATTALILMARWWCKRSEALLFWVVLLCYRIWCFPHWHILNYSPVAVTLSLTATWTMGEHLRHRTRMWVVLSGICCGLAIFTKQDSGAATTIALGLSMLLIGPPGRPAIRLRQAMVFATAFSAVVATCLAGIWYAGYLPDLLREAVYAPLYGVGDVNYLQRPSLMPLFGQDFHVRQNAFSYYPVVFMEPYWASLKESWIFRETGLIDTAIRAIYHAPWIIPSAAALHSFRRWKQGTVNGHRVLIILLAGAFSLAFNPPQDWVHLLILYSPTLVILASFAPWIRSHTLLRWTSILTICAAALVSTHLLLKFHQRRTETVHTPRGTFFEEKYQAESLRAILDVLVSAPIDTPLLAYPYLPALNFLTDRPLVSRHTFLWPVERNKNRDDEVIESLENSPDATVIWSPRQLIHLGTPRDYAPKFFNYLVDNFRIAQTYSAKIPYLTFLRLEKESIPHAGRNLLKDALEHGYVTKRAGDQPAEILEAGLTDFIRVEPWPFRRAITIKTQPAAEVALHIPYTPRHGERLRTSYASNPGRWPELFLPAATFRLSITTNEGESTLIEREVRSGTIHADRQWHEVDIDLERWANQEIKINLGVWTMWGTQPAQDLAGWGVPYIQD